MRWPAYVEECFRLLEKAGRRGWLVGGCVRDLAMGGTPGDWDMASDARPEELLSLFPKAAPTGLKHGTVTAVLEGGTVEVTTLRREGGYTDGRHPDQVVFVDELEVDLARRDFTINAMAMDRRGRISDPFGGREDLRRGVIRCVGAPERRFSEDGLRMFRAVRFAARLGFALEPGTAAALRTCAPLAERVSAERVREEVDKVLCSPRPEQAELLFRDGLMTAWTARRAGAFHGLTRLPPRRLERWAALCAAVEEEPEPFLRRLKAERRLIRACQAGWRLRERGLPRDGAGWRRALARAGEDGARAAAAMGGPEALAELEEALASGCCWQAAGLALTGGELAAMGLRGEEIGAARRWLLERVLDHPEDNRPERLRSLAEGWRASGPGR